MLVKFWHQPQPVFLHHPSRLVAVLVVFESVIDRESGHPDVNTRFERIAFGIEPQNGRMFGDCVIEQNHVDVVVKGWFLRRSSRPFQHQLLESLLPLKCQPTARTLLDVSSHPA